MLFNYRFCNSHGVLFAIGMACEIYGKHIAALHKIEFLILVHPFNGLYLILHIAEGICTRILTCDSNVDVSAASEVIYEKVKTLTVYAFKRKVFTYTKGSIRSAVIHSLAEARHPASDKSEELTLIRINLSLPLRTDVEHNFFNLRQLSRKQTDRISELSVFSYVNSLIAAPTHFS